LEDLGHVSQVEGIVGLGWNRLKFVLNSRVDDLSGIDNLFGAAFDFIRENREVSVYNLAENHLNRVVVQH